MLAAGTTAMPAWAAAPANDEYAGAVPVSIGDHITLDTTQATTTSADAALNANCGAPATKASVWYTYSAAADDGVVLDMSASDYSGGFLVFAGTPTADSLVTCGAEVLGFQVSAGTTYAIMVVDDDLDGNSANGGNLVLDVIPGTPPPTLTVDPRATVDKAGTVWVTGTYVCTRADFIDVEGDLRQRVGRGSVQGYGSVFDEGTCDGTVRPFTMGITAVSGKFAGGKAASITFAFACGDIMCAEGYIEQTIQLTKGR